MVPDTPEIPDLLEKASLSTTVMLELGLEAKNARHQ
jgi:hypothetical protein